MPSILSTTRHPTKAIYTLFAIAFETARVSIWTLIYLLPSARPNPKWTYKQAVMTRILKSFLRHASKVEMQVPCSLEPGALGDRFVVIDPNKYINQGVYIGPTEDESVRPAKIGGTWYKSAPTGSLESSEEDVVLHFHGGAFVVGDGRPDDAGFLAKNLIAETGASRVFCPQYRLASHPTSTRFPGQLQDALTSYLYLLWDLNVPAKRIIISGDSAGGNIALTLLRYLADYGLESGLEEAGAAFLWSPWVDVATGLEVGAMESNPNYPTDYLNSQFGIWGANSIIGAHHHYKLPAKQAEAKTKVDPSNKYLTHINNPFSTSTPIFLHVSDKEILYGEDKKFAEQMKGVKGNTLELYAQADVVHDIVLVGHVVGFVDEAKVAMRKAGEFLKEERKL